MFAGTVFIITSALIFNSEASFNSVTRIGQNDEDSLFFSEEDTLANVKAVGPQFKLKPDPAFPVGEITEQNGIQLRTPANFKSTMEYDPVTKQYVFVNKIGKNVNYRESSTMTMKEYRNYEMKRSIREYWQTQANGGKSPAGGYKKSFNLGGETFDKIFGGSTISIIPQGQAELVFGVKIDTRNDPLTPINLRTVPTFNFEENIQMNVTGMIGERLKMTINYNTDATFDFENKTKLEYTGEEDDIVKKVEAGDVSLPLPGTLITGSQSLFGIKTEMQFGKLTVTSILSQQKGQSQVIQVQGGAQVTEFEIKADEYENNRNFLLNHSFREKYNKAFNVLPAVSSDINITKIEIWVLNKSRDNKETRDKVYAFMDLGEADTSYLMNKYFTILQKDPENKANTLYSTFKDIIENNQPISSANVPDFALGTDYEVIDNARRLDPSEFEYNPKLGYISLKTEVASSEKLAVAYQYQKRGAVLQVGEFASDKPAGKPLILKLLKGASSSPKLKTWDLMMKNIYSLGAYDVSNDDFELYVMYHSDAKGTDITYLPEESKNNPNLLALYKLDNFNSQLSGSPDGVFDFIDGVTIDRKNGRIIFPTLEPFGISYLNQALKDSLMASKYAYSELYDLTLTKARLVAEKNKFKLKGSYKAASSSEIYLNAMNIPQGSVRVSSGGIPLKENEDYVVDYSMGSVKIINAGYLKSGQPIKVSLENNSMFNLQTKTLVGTHMDYKFNDDFNLGATVMHLNETPLTKKVNIGDEPVSNTIWGLNGTYRANSQFLTTLIDKLPLIETKEISTFTLTGEFAQLIPGASSAIGSNGIAYIDDFEGTKSTYDLLSPYSWHLASVPTEMNNTGGSGLESGFKRAKIAWFDIDRVLTRDQENTPSVISNNKDVRKNPYVRSVEQKEIFPYMDNGNSINTEQQITNISYYPQLKGPYNFLSDSRYDANNDILTNPKENWGGIMRSIEVNDFEAANVEYIEFWMMDPFVLDPSNKGKLTFNLGEVSEDVLRDGARSFENGLAATSDSAKMERTLWAKVPTVQNTITEFSNDVNVRKLQDVGLDGFTNDEEYNFCIDNKLSTGAGDPAHDDFRHFLDPIYNDNPNILDRYMDFNGTDRNSPVSSSTIPLSSYSTPDDEDISEDFTLDQTESYYIYSIDLDSNSLEVGKNYITASKAVEPYEIKPGEKRPVTWYQFKIPVNSFSGVVGNIDGFSSIRFIRMYLSEFERPVFLRFATFDLVRSEWRKYQNSLLQATEGTTVQPTDGVLDVQAINIEENSTKTPVPYALPPGVDRETDPSQTSSVQLNEQSMLLKVTDLADGDARAVFKDARVDMRQYKKLKMYIHCESVLGYDTLRKGDITAFVRIGSDYKNNYYEYEIPLAPTPVNGNSFTRESIWPASNNIDIELMQLMQIKQARNDANVSPLAVFSKVINGHRYSVCGNPTLSDIRAVMIGIRNPGDSYDGTFRNDNKPKSAEIWVNELRLTDFSDEGGWAANARAQVKLADFGNIRVAGSYIGPGFGSIEKKVNDRAKEETQQYDVAADFELGKLFPEKAQVKIPMFMSYSVTKITPQYNPLDPDIPLQAQLNNEKDENKKAAIESRALDMTYRKSINFTNVKVNKTSKTPQFYDPANFSVSYGYSRMDAHNYRIEFNRQTRHEGSFNYIFNNRPKLVQPLKKIKPLNNKYTRIIGDFNFYYSPTSVSFRTNMIRDNREMLLRNINKAAIYDQSIKLNTTYQNDWVWNRLYDVKFDLTRGLKLDFSANNTARIYERYHGQQVDSIKSDYDLYKDEVWDQIKRFGHTTNYNQNINISYTVPINKLPGLDWTSLQTRYSAGYEWSYRPSLYEKNEVGGFDKIDLGNDIKNNRTISINGGLNLNSIYNKISFLRDLTSKRNDKKQEMTTVTFEKEYPSLKAGIARSITHKLNSQEVTVKVTDSKGNTVNGKLEINSSSRVTFTPDIDVDNAKVLVEAKVPLKPNPFIYVLRTTGRMLLGVKSINVSYTISQGTTLGGYLQGSYLFGSSRYNGSIAPGFAFIMGDQDTNVFRRLFSKELITTEEMFNTPMVMNNTRNLNIKVDFEPIDGLRIDLTGNHNYSENVSRSYYIKNNARGIGELMPNSLVTFSGNFSMTVMSFNSFESLSESNQFKSKTFTEFLSSRKTIQGRLERTARENNFTTPGGLSYDKDKQLHNDTSGYGINSQQVLIPSFLATYGNFGTAGVPMELVPSFKYIRPNWRINYDGLSDIPLIQEYFRSVSINHTYSATYSVGSFLNNPRYKAEKLIRDLNGYNYIVAFDATAVSVNEQFSPLFGVDMTWQNNLTTRFEYKRSRMVALSLSNNSIVDSRNNEYVLGLGYRFDELPFIFQTLSGVQTSVKSDLNLRADFTLRDDISSLRKVTEDENKITETPSSGNMNMKISFSADYSLSDKFNLRLFFDRTFNNPYVGSFQTTNTSFGFSIRFTLAQ